MKKLSDYRIKEENGKFYIEGKSASVTKRFLRNDKVETKWLIFSTFTLSGNSICTEFDTLEAATAQIIKWCEEPKIIM